MEEPLFHRIHTALLHPNPARPVFVRCPICTVTQLSIRGLRRYQPRDPEDLPDFAPGVVLMCGHMACAACWTAYARHALDNADNRDGDPPLSCPICRLVLEHTVCGCNIEALDMPMHPTDETATAQYREWFGGEDYRYADDEWADEFPPTFPDGIDELPDVCGACWRGRNGLEG